MFNLLDVISVFVCILIVVGAVSVYRYLRRQVDDAEGVCSINEDGEEGDVVGEISPPGAGPCDR